MSSSPEFRIADTLWDAWMADPVMRSEIERLLEEREGERLRRRLEEREGAWAREVREQARKEGYEEGLRLARAELDELRGTVERTCLEILKAEARLLQRHETSWAKALSAIAKQFLVRRDAEVCDRIRAWVQRNLEGLGEKAKIRVYLSREEFGRVADRLSLEASSRWHWESDPELKDGEVRVESDFGGLLFQPGEEWDRLEALVRRHVEGNGA